MDTRRFARFVYEAPEAPAAPATLEEPPDPRGVAVEPEPIEAPPATLTTPEETPEELLAGKFKTQDELVAGYQTSEQAMHDALEEKARLEAEIEALRNPEPEFDPYAPLTQHGTMTEEEGAKIAGFVLKNPEEAMIWAQHEKTQAEWGPLIESQVLEFWQDHVPGGRAAAAKFYARQELAAARAETEQVKATLVDNWAERASANLESELTAEIPTWSDPGIRARVDELWLSYQNDYGFTPSPQNVDKAKAMLKHLHTIAFAEKYPSTIAPETSGPSPAAARAITEQGGRTTIPAGEDANYEAWAGTPVA